MRTTILTKDTSVQVEPSKKEVEAQVTNLGPSTAAAALQVDLPRQSSGPVPQDQPHHAAQAGHRAGLPTPAWNPPLVDDLFCTEEDFTMADQSERQMQENVANCLAMIDKSISPPKYYSFHYL